MQLPLAARRSAHSVVTSPMRRCPGAAELADVAVARAAETLRDQPVEARAEHLGAPHAKLLGGAVEENDLLLVDRDHGVHGRIDDRPQPRPASSPCDALRFLLRLQAPRDVAQDDGVEAPPPSAACEIEASKSFVGAQRPERGDVAHAPAGDAGAPEVLDVSAVRSAEALRQEAVERRAERLFATHAEASARRRG